MNSIDLVIEEYKKTSTRRLIDECLKRTVEERIQALEEFEEFEEFREELQRAVRLGRLDPAG